MIPMKGQRLNKSQRDILEADRQSHLTMEQRGHLNRLHSEVEDKLGALVKAEQAHLRETAGGDRGRMQQSNRRLMIAKDAHQAAVVNHSAACKAFGLRD